MCRHGLLLLDEPFSGLDCVTLRSVIDLLRALMRQQDVRGIILVTHDVDAVLESCDRLLLLGRDPVGRERGGRDPGGHDSSGSEPVGREPGGRDSSERDGPAPGARIQRDFDLRAMGIGPARRDPAARRRLLEVRQAICEAFKAL